MIKNNKIISLLLTIFTQSLIRSQTNPYPFPTETSYPFKLIGSQQILSGQPLSDVSHVFYNNQGDKIMISLVFLEL
jgi:hypothetical protein